jgi:MraZ protein
LFLGQYRYSFDDKDRLMIPARFRELLADGAFVTQGFDRNLVILTPVAFQEIYQLIMALNIADPLARFLLRMFLGNATQLEVDESGRIVLPGNLREFANLAGEAVLIGQGDYFEVWAPAFWSQQETHLQDAEANAMRFVTLNLARH